MSNSPLPEPTVRAFVNAQPVDVATGASALEAVRLWNPDAAAAVVAGSRMITDSRGLPIDGDAVVSAGSIFRVVSRRPNTDHEL